MTALGCIADDFTGGTDVAAALRRAGLSVTLHFGLPDPADQTTSDAVVIALKTRTMAAADAVDQSLSALDRLRDRGVEQVYFKYCSTFDSTPEGNIGPVADALLGRLGESMTLVCPASPEHGRTVYQGHLFVGDTLLSESSMRHHPLTPMTDAKLQRLLAPQTDGRLGLLPLATVREGADAVTLALKRLADEQVRHVVVDAVTEADLAAVASGSRGLRLFTGGAGLAGSLAARLGPGPGSEATPHEPPWGPGLVLAGSCSAATLAQVAAAAEVLPAYRLDPAAIPDAEAMLDRAREWLRRTWGEGPVLVYSSAGPDDRARARAAMGANTSDILERTLGQLAREAVALGATRVVVAGGETSGAVVQALGVRSVVVDGEADRGVPWCRTSGTPSLALLLKSGNFGAPDLLVRAVEGTSHR
jgi:uncharacterized protein YgbK (DUF1537 family)